MKYFLLLLSLTAHAEVDHCKGWGHSSLLTSKTPRTYKEGIQLGHTIGDRGSEDGLAIKGKVRDQGASVEILNELIGVGH